MKTSTPSHLALASGVRLIIVKAKIQMVVKLQARRAPVAQLTANYSSLSLSLASTLLDRFHGAHVTSAGGVLSNNVYRKML